MEIVSLGFRTDLMVLALGGSEIEHGERHVAVHTPANPTFWWGNFVLFADPVGPGEIPGRLALFADAFPGAEHVAWGIDSVDGTIGAETELASAGFELSRDTVLAASALRPPARGVEAELRPLAGDEDWRQALELRIACLPDDEHYTEPFVRAHLAGSRALCERGSATWFGAFEHGALRSALGVVSDGDGLARFQMVETHPEARRRGLATALVHRAGRAALDAGAETLVIVADPAYHAIDLYRSVGFDDRETKVELTRRPPAGAPGDA
ncbi:MAG TPA: GNAT family N-acetyltransferase [Gaiella sp.]